MRRFKSPAHAQRFLSVHGLVRNLFRVGRHLLRAVHHRFLRTRSFRVWDAVNVCLLNHDWSRVIDGSLRPLLVNLTVSIIPLPAEIAR